MDPGVYHLSLRLGQSERLPFSVSDKNGPLDLTGSLVTAQISIGETALECNVQNGRIHIVSAVQGKWEMVLSSAEIQSFSQSLGTWWTKIHWTNGDDWELLAGSASVR